MSNASIKKINNKLRETENSVKKEISSKGKPGNKSKNNDDSLFNKFTNISDSFKKTILGSNKKSKKDKGKKNKKEALNKLNKIKSLKSLDEVNNLKNSNNDNNNENNKSDQNPFNNINLLIALLLITVFFISYGIYKYLKDTKQNLDGKTFYGQDLTNYKPLFKLNTDDIDVCKKRCNADVECSGISYNNELLSCVGTKNGVLRNDTKIHTAWVKPKKSKTKSKVNTISGLISNKTVLAENKVPLPVVPSSFNYSFYIYITDYYTNHGKWRHVFHKGTEITEIDTHEWEKVMTICPDQGVGVWLAPFNNNLRVCITTRTNNLKNDFKPHIHPFEEKYEDSEYDSEKDCLRKKENIYISDKPYNPQGDKKIFTNLKKNAAKNNELVYEKNMEFIDVFNVPVKKVTHISINLLNTNLEIFIDGKLIKSSTLQGEPLGNEGHFYAKHNKSFEGSIMDVKFSPTSIDLNEIRKLIKNQNFLSKQM